MGRAELLQFVVGDVRLNRIFTTEWTEQIVRTSIHFVGFDDEESAQLWTRKRSDHEEHIPRNSRRPDPTHCESMMRQQSDDERTLILVVI